MNDSLIMEDELLAAMHDLEQIGTGHRLQGLADHRDLIIFFDGSLADIFGRTRQHTARIMAELAAQLHIKFYSRG